MRVDLRRISLALIAMLVFGVMIGAGAQAGSLDTRLAKLDSLESVLVDAIPRWHHVNAFEQASEILDARSALLGAEHPKTLNSLYLLAKVCHLAGEQELSRSLLDLLLSSQRQTLRADDPALAASLHLLGLVARYSGDRDLSRECYQEALGILAKNPGEKTCLNADILQAQASWLRGKSLDEALMKYKEALLLRRQCSITPSFETADNLTWLGWTLARAGRADEAAKYLLEAKRLLQDLGMSKHSLMGTLLNLEADEALINKHYAQAESIYSEVSLIFEAARYNHFPGFSRRKSPLDGFNNLAVAQLQQGRGREAWSSMETAKAALSLDFLTLGRWRQDEAASYQRVHEVRSEYLKIQRQLEYLRWHDEEREPSNQKDLWLLKIRLARQYYRLEQAYLLEKRPDVPSVKALQDQLPPRSAYVGWLAARVGVDTRSKRGSFFSGHWMFVIRPEGPVHWIPLWATRSLDEYRKRHIPWAHYMELCNRATEWQLRVGPDLDMRRSARLLSRWFFDPALPWLEDVESLVVEWSAGLPLESLVGPDGKYLGERFAVSYIPSAAAYVLLSTREKNASKLGGPLARSILSLGNPRFNQENPINQDNPSTGDSIQPGFIDVAALRNVLSRDPKALDNLPQLPLSGYEAKRVASLFPQSTLLLGENASERSLQRLAVSDSLLQFDIIHLASHALIGAVPERCAIALSRQPSDLDRLRDGLVDAEEILMEWQLDAKIVTLSGCQTARSSGYTRGEFVGFNQALFGAGAKAIISSMWKVDDTATALLMERFYQNLTGNYDLPRRGKAHTPMRKAQALQEAKIWLRTTLSVDGAKRFEHPIYWSGFILTGTLN